MKKEFLIALFFFSAATGFSQSSKMPETVSGTMPVPIEDVQTRHVNLDEKSIFEAYSDAQKAVLISWGYPEYVNTGDEEKDRRDFSLKVHAWRLANAANFGEIKTQMQTN